MTDLSRRAMMWTTAAVPIAAALPFPALAEAEPNSLASRSVLITGCSSGFGRGIALRCAHLGATVFASMRGLPRREAQTLLSDAKGLDLQVIDIDVTDNQSVERGVSKVKAILGGAPDILVNNAGVAIVGPIEAQDMEATRLAYETNVFGYHRMIRSVLPEMRARESGHIVNISSQSGRMIWPGLGHYCPTKFAVEAMSETLAYEIADFGVDVTIIQPGGYPTQFWDNREALTLNLKQRSDPKHLEGYGPMSANMGAGNVPQLKGNPSNVAEAVARCLSAPSDQVPLRVMVSAAGHPQETINQINADVHRKFVGRGGFKDAVNRVHDA